MYERKTFTMSLFTWVIFGILVGIAANSIDSHPSEGGILPAVILGVVGAVVGGFLATVIFGFGLGGFNMTSFSVAVLSSLFLLMLGRALRST
jgi:uncharacterized membrane protein YeaQ/YmgE (transglycosylase-associated protein family)